MTESNSERTPSREMPAVRPEELGEAPVPSDSTPPRGTPPAKSLPPAPSTGSLPPVLPYTGEMRPVTGEARPVQQETGCGCWLPLLVTLFVTAILVVVALFLPPINLLDRLLGTQYVMLDASGNGVQVEGMSFVVAPEALTSEFGVQINRVALNEFTAGLGVAWAPAALAAVPPNLALQSAVYQVQTSGQTPEAINITLDIPAAGSPDLLDLYAWDTQRGVWVFVPSQDTGSALTATLTTLPDAVALFQALPPEQPAVLVAVDNTPLTREVAEIATIVTPAGVQPTVVGTLVGSLMGGFDVNAGYRVMPVVRNFADPRAIDSQTVTALLGNSTLRSEHVRQVTALVVNGNFDGVFIDYRDLPADQRDNFSAFIRDLGENLDRAGLLLGVVLPPAQNVAGMWETGAYDWRALGAAADFVYIDLGIDPNTFRPGQNQLVEAMLRWAVGEVARHKLLIGLSARSVREAAGAFTPIGYDDALSGLGNVTVDAAQQTDTGIVQPGTSITASLDGYEAASGQDSELQAPFIDYLNADGSRLARMWLTTGEALRFRMDRTIPFALAGVGFGDVLYNGVAEGVLQAIFNYKLGLPAAPTTTEVLLRWTIEGTNGVIGQATTELNQPLVATVNAPDGNYAVNVDVVIQGSADVESARSGAAVAVFAPTPTPTPLPTSTPTPTPTPTFTPAPIVATSTSNVSAPSGGAGSVVGPVAGSIAVGTFEYGGHVTSADSDRAANAMRQAGMTWMKVQLRYGVGSDTSAAAAAIAGARARGFRILLGTVGDPNELAAGGGGYIAQYAGWLGQIAALGPDAIEVWNEPNIVREWPEGQISGGAYFEMLRQGYQAIKGANSSVIVISAAPAPTGAEGAFPGRVVNDDNWITQLVQAGGLNYMDCFGAHYNEGIVGPDQTTGDPRDNYYTRYFQGMLNTYWSLIGGARPICFTELGYLTPEGYPPLGSFWAWGQNTTIAQQASWLARAAALSSQSGRVRLMIVWNVDFTGYTDGDPQAGYAMIRADGSCPACAAFASSR